MCYRLLSFLMALIATLSCIRNDIPYPDVKAEITSLQVIGAKSVSIDKDAMVVVVTLEEAADIHNVSITGVTFNEKAVEPSVSLTGTHDLSSPYSFTLNLYDRDFGWKIRAEQPVERYLTVAGQTGESVIDAENLRVLFKIPMGIDMRKLSVTSMKLGPEEITRYNPTAAELHDFSNPVVVMASYKGVTQEWTLFAERVKTSVTMFRPEPWTRVAWLKASGIEGRDNGFRIRKTGETQWRNIGDVTSIGGTFTAMADGLEPLTDYECVAFSGDEVTGAERFTTEAERQLPNSGFETFSNAESTKYYSFYNPDLSDPTLKSKWWGSGNKGSTTVGSSYAITKPDETEKVEGKYSLKMESQYVIVKFAAGNVFSGEYAGNVGISGGKIRMGRPFTLRPRKLTAWIKYKSGKIQQKTLGGYPEGDEVKVGDNDRGIVWMALGDWSSKDYGGSADCPVEVNTTKKDTFFDPKGPNVIAYGKFVTDHDMGWTKIEIPLEYVSTSRRPTHIIVSCAASMLGDYFTGSPDSIMWIDDIRLEY